jgi:uncharacterized protein
MPTKTSEAASFDLPDVNVLVALAFPDHVHHEYAAGWFEETEQFATTPVTETGLLRHALNPRIAGQQLSGHDVVQIVRDLRADPRTRFIGDASSLAEATIDMSVLAGHRQVTDLHLLNLAAANGGTLVTFDRSLERSLAPSDRPHVRTLA